MNPASFPNLPVRCDYTLRTEDGTDPDTGETRYRYTPIVIANPTGDGCLLTFTPPAVGDHILLTADRPAEGLDVISGLFKVYDRMWHPAGWGSTHWSHGSNSRMQTEPLWLELFVDAAPGLYVNEVDDTDGNGPGTPHP